MPVNTLPSQYTTRPLWPPLSGSRLYGSSLTLGLTTLTVTANILYATAIFIPNSCTVTDIGIEVTTNATGNVRLGMYNDNAGVPGSLKFDAGAVSTGTSNDYKHIGSLSNALTPNLYWLAAVFSATPGVRALSASNSFGFLLGFTSGTDTTVHAGWSVAFTYAALPDPFTGGGALTTINPPRVMIQV